MTDTKRKNVISGVEDYITAQKFYYVDKTLLIRELLTDDGAAKGGSVKLISRPRRSGKTLNMDMIKTFFEKSDMDTSVFFQDKKIWQCGEGIKSRQGKYPVVFLSLSNADCGNWKDTYSWLIYLISKEFKRHAELCKSPALDDGDVSSFKRIASGKGSMTDYRSSLEALTAMLHKHYGEKPIVLIDEYDIPIQDGFNNGYYAEVMNFMRGFMSSCLKTNSDFEFAILTGVLQISGENMFSGLNNLVPCSVLDNNLSEYFGFTRDEVKEMLAYYGHDDKFDEICEWYDGYKFGDTEIFNPWSVLRYVESGYRAEPYWVNTSRNSLLQEMISHATLDVAAGLAALSAGEAIEVEIKKNLTYAQFNEPANVFALLLYAGYIKATGFSAGGSKYLVRVPNKEVTTVFESEISAKTAVYQSSFDILWSALEELDSLKMEEEINNFLSRIMSFRNTAYEDFYQCFMMCVGEYKSGKYYISTEMESGDGLLDVCFEPKDKSGRGYIFELKSVRKDADWNSGSDEGRAAMMAGLKQEAEGALKQINANRYDTALANRGIKDIAKIGVAFMGKHAKVVIGR